MEISYSGKGSFGNYCCKRMSVQKEFIKLFYEVLYQAALEGKDLTHHQAFDLLNKLYFKMTGKLRYKDYVSFCINRIRTDNILLSNKNK